jgi:hypothetical protein
MTASGVTGSLVGQEERNREQIASLDQCISLLAMVKPAVIVFAHTVTSYTIGMPPEKALVARVEATHGCRFITAFGSVVSALMHLGVTRVALGTPYAMTMTVRGKVLSEENGFAVPNHPSLPGVTNIYDETPKRAYQLGRMAGSPRCGGGVHQWDDVARLASRRRARKCAECRPVAEGLNAAAPALERGSVYRDVPYGPRQPTSKWIEANRVLPIKLGYPGSLTRMVGRQDRFGPQSDK